MIHSVYFGVHRKAISCHNLSAATGEGDLYSRCRLDAGVNKCLPITQHSLSNNQSTTKYVNIILRTSCNRYIVPARTRLNTITGQVNTWTCHPCNKIVENVTFTHTVGLMPCFWRQKQTPLTCYRRLVPGVGGRIGHGIPPSPILIGPPSQTIQINRCQSSITIRKMAAYLPSTWNGGNEML